MTDFIRTFRTTRRGLGVSMLAIAAASLSACTRIDLHGPHGRIVLDSHPRHGRRHKGRHGHGHGHGHGHHDDDDN